MLSTDTIWQEDRNIGYFQYRGTYKDMDIVITAEEKQEELASLYSTIQLAIVEDIDGVLLDPIELDVLEIPTIAVGNPLADLFEASSSCIPLWKDFHHNKCRESSNRWIHLVSTFSSEFNPNRMTWLTIHDVAENGNTM